MAWYGENWPMQQQNYTREQVTDERQMWEQNMETGNHVAFQHFPNFAPYYRHNMVNVAAVPGFTGMKFPDGHMFPAEQQPANVIPVSNEMPSTSSKIMPTEEVTNVMTDQMRMGWKNAPIMQETQPEVVSSEIPVTKTVQPPPLPAVSSGKPAVSSGKAKSKSESTKTKKRNKSEKPTKGDKGKRKSKKKAAAAAKAAENDGSPFQCNVCQKFFEFEASLKTHSILHTGGGQLYKRALLQKSRVEKAKIKSKLARTLQCPKCGEWFAQARSLERHNLKAHST